MLRSVVIPLEEEIKMLKAKVKDTADYADTLRTKVHYLSSVDFSQRGIIPL